MIKIGPTQAILLSYYQGLAPCGEWIMPVPAYVLQDIGMKPSLARIIAQRLVRNGLLEERKEKRCRSHEYRVVKRLESPDVVIGDWGRRTDSAKQKMREKALEREARKRLPVKRPLVRFAGYDKRELSAWN